MRYLRFGRNWNKGNVMEETKKETHKNLGENQLE